MHDVYDILHARIFDLFSDVFCIFVDDLSDFNSVVNHLRCWVITKKTSNLLWLSVVIVKCDSEFHVSSTFISFETRNVQFTLNQKILKNFYSSIAVFHLIDEKISPLARFRPLKELLWRRMDEMRNVWLHCQRLYSAVHLNKFFQLVISQTALFILQPFNFVIASWINNEIGPNHVNHLITFLRFEIDDGFLNNIMTIFIISIILLNAYLFKMHHESCINNMHWCWLKI